MNRYIPMIVALFVLPGALAGGCADTDLSLLDADDPEWSERRRRMDVTVRTYSGGTPQPSFEMTPLDFRDYVVGTCVQRVRTNSSFSTCVAGTAHLLTPPTPASTSCVDIANGNGAICMAEIGLCAAQLYMELAEGVASQDLVHRSTAVLIAVPPQTTATRAGFAEAAAQYAAYSATMSGESIRRFAGDTAAVIGTCGALTGTISVPTGGTVTHGAEFAHVMLEARRVAEEATMLAVDFNVAVGDNDFSRIPDRALASRTLWRATALSRRHAVGLIVGELSAPSEPSRDFGSPTRALSDALGDHFLGATCDAGCEEAVGLIRSSGAPLTSLTGTVPMSPTWPPTWLAPASTWLTGTAAVDDRIAEHTNDYSLIGLTPAQFAGRFGLTEVDFWQARDYLVAESIRFDRRTDLNAPTRNLPTGTAAVNPSVYSDSLATMLPPDALPAGVLTANARGFGGSPGNVVTFRPSDADARRSLMHLTDYVDHIARVGIRNSNLPLDVKDALAPTVALGEFDRNARVQACWQSNTSIHDLRFLVIGRSDPSQRLQIVRGTAGLACATTGEVERRPCNLANYILTTNQSGPTALSAVDGYDRYMTLTVSSANAVSAGVDQHQQHLYVVEPRLGVTTPIAGDYLHVAGWGLPTFSLRAGRGGLTAGTYTLCELIPGVQEYDTAISSAMASNPNHVDRPATTCFREPLDGLPLEDILIDDGSEAEDSFAYHLGVARVAADEADMLGEMLINAGLAIDERAEEAIEAIELRCGGSINVDGTFSALDADPSSAGGVALTRMHDPVGCTTTCPDADYACVGGQCIIDLGRAGSADVSADTRLLAECLGLGTDGEGEIVRAVSVGSRPVCVTTSATTNELCATPGAAGCPWFTDQPGAPACGGAGTLAAEPLGLVESPSTSASLVSTSIGADRNLCDTIRELRALPAGPSRLALFSMVTSTNFFSMENVHAVARRVGWRGNPGDYSELTIDGSPWYYTGQPFEELAVPDDGDGVPEPGEYVVGTSPSWPCTDDFYYTPAPSCPGGNPSLFCRLQNGCDTVAERTGTNIALARAAIVLNVFGGAGSNNLRIPALYTVGVSDTPVFEGAALYHTPPITEWRVFDAIEWPTGRATMRRLSGVVAVPTIGVNVWSYPSVFTSTESQPFGFYSFGFNEDSDRSPALRELAHVWGGMTLSSPTRASVHPGCASAEPFRNAMLGNTAFINGRTGECYGHWQARGVTNFFDEDAFATYTGSYPTNQAYIHGSGASGEFTSSDLLDGMELMCEAARHVERGLPTCDLTRPPVLDGREDIAALSAYLDCLGARLISQSERVVLQDVPRSLVRDLRGESTALRPTEGEYGREVDLLRSALRDLADIPRAIGGQLRQIADALEILDARLAQSSIRAEIGDLNTVSTAVTQVSACASSGTWWGAVATCAGAAIQIGLAVRVNELSDELLTGESAIAMAEFRREFNSVQFTLGSLGTQLMTSRDQVGVSLSSLRSMRTSTMRDLANALVLSTDEAGRHYAVNTVLRRRYNTLLRRYDVARRGAIRMAWLARVALEQRLGLDLSTVVAPDGGFTLVDAPATWADSLCESSGVDYAEIRDGSSTMMDHYSDAFIGDYVRNLERFFESYRIDFPYLDGEATAVISLRNDVERVRERCVAETRNLLASSNDLTQDYEPRPDGAPVAMGDDDTVPPRAWEMLGCVPSGPPRRDACIAVSPVADGPPIGSPEPDRPVVTPFRVVFASSADGTGAELVTYSDSAEWSQTVSVVRGLYRLSWWARDAGGTSAHRPNLVALRSTDAGVLGTHTPGLTPVGPIDGWYQYVRFYDVPRSGDVRVAIVPKTGFTHPIEQAYDVAGIQLEAVSDVILEPATTITDADMTALPRLYRPADFFATTARGVGLLSACEDVDGSSFRSDEYWHAFCEPVCTAAGDCSERCGWETDPMVIDPDEGFSSDGLFGRAPSITGNFNHRIETIALNFVGTATRICDDPSRPSSCYTSAYIPYSIVHEPPYQVIDWYGETTYEAPLFEGRIGFASGLAAERYITNPVSPADAALLAPYTREELRGRPLSGRIRIRVWDTGEVNFDGIEDVQIVLGYRYFTRTRAPRP